MPQLPAGPGPKFPGPLPLPIGMAPFASKHHAKAAQQLYSSQAFYKNKNMPGRPLPMGGCHFPLPIGGHPLPIGGRSLACMAPA